jgi:hypothetical protein
VHHSSVTISSSSTARVRFYEFSFLVMVDDKDRARRLHVGSRRCAIHLTQRGYSSHLTCIRRGPRALNRENLATPSPDSKRSSKGKSEIGIAGGLRRRGGLARDSRYISRVYLEISHDHPQLVLNQFTLS